MVTMTMANLPGAFSQGYGNALTLMDARDRRDRTNALNTFYREQGPALLSGDQNALAGLAALDAPTALRIQNQQRTTDLQNRRFDLDSQRIGLEMQRIRSQMSAEEAARTAANIRRAIARADAIYDVDEFNAYMDEVGQPDFKIDPNATPELLAEHKENLIVRVQTFAEMLERNQPYEAQSPAGKVAADVAAGLLPEGTTAGRDSAAEAKIARIMELQNPGTGQPYTRDEAIRVADLVSLSNDGQLVSREDGRVIQPAPVQGPVDTTTGETPVPMFGPVGLGATGLNALLDMAGFPMVAPEHEEAREELKNINTRAMIVLANEFPGRPNMLTQERIEGVFLNPNRIFQGGQGARIQAEDARNLLAFTYEAARRVAESTSGYTAQQRAEAREAVTNLEPLMAHYQRLVEAMDRNTGGSQVDPADVQLMNELLAQ